MKNRMKYWIYKLAYPHAMCMLIILYPFHWVMHFSNKVGAYSMSEMNRLKEGLPTMECYYGLKSVAAGFSFPMFMIILGLMYRVPSLDSTFTLIAGFLFTVLPAYGVVIEIYDGTEADEYIKMIAKESRKQHVIWALISYGVPAILWCLAFYLLIRK